MSIPAPKLLDHIKIDIVTTDEQTIDITSLMVELSIFESIYSINLHGHLYLMDNVSLFSSLPILGQEKIVLEFDRLGTTVSKTFHITGVVDVKQNDSAAVYKLLFTSETKVKNNVSEFSRSFDGNSVQIMKEIYEEFFKPEEIEVLTYGSSSSKYVIPFMKPMQAINMIQMNASDTSFSPIFIFERLYKKAVITSLSEMTKADSIEKPSIKLNKNNETGQGLRDTIDNIGKVYDFSLDNCHKTLEQIGDGAYSNNISNIDLSTKTYTPKTFNAVLDDYDTISSFYNIGGKDISTINTTRTYNNTDVSLAYSELTSLYDNPVSAVTRDSHIKRLDTITGTIHMDSIPNVSAGDCIDLTMRKFKPVISDEDNVEDVLNSGKYLIASLRHIIKRNEYTMSAKVIRSNIGIKV